MARLSRAVSLRPALVALCVGLLSAAAVWLPVAPAQAADRADGLSLPPITESLSKSVTILDADGSPAHPPTGVNGLPDAKAGQLLKYTLRYSLTGSFKLYALTLSDDIGPIIDGFGSLVPGSITTSGNLTAADVSLTGTPTQLRVSIPATGANGTFSGIADGSYWVTYEIRLADSLPDSPVPGGCNAGAYSDPARQEAGVAAETNRVSVSAVGDDGNPVTQKDEDNVGQGIRAHSQAAVNLVTKPTPPRTPPHQPPVSPPPLAHTGTAIASIALGSAAVLGSGFGLVLARRRRDTGRG